MHGEIGGSNHTIPVQRVLITSLRSLRGSLWHTWRGAHSDMQPHTFVKVIVIFSVEMLSTVLLCLSETCVQMLVCVHVCVGVCTSLLIWPLSQLLFLLQHKVTQCSP